MRGPVAAVGGRVLDAQAQKLIAQTFANVRTPPVMSDFFDRVTALRRDGHSFAVATVVATAIAGLGAPWRPCHRLPRRPG